MIVEVTQKDIDEGVPGDSLYCPIAKAIRRKQKKSVRVTQDRIVTNLRKPTYYIVPRTVWRWMSDFDNGGNVTPISFDLKKYEHRGGY